MISIFCQGTSVTSHLPESRSQRSSDVGNGSSLLYSYLENSMDRRAWWASVHGVAKSRTWLSTWAHINTCILFHYRLYKMWIWFPVLYSKSLFLSVLYIVVCICREGNGTPLQYSCLENPMGGGAWWAAVHGVAKSRTRLSDFTFTFHFHALKKEMATHSSVLAWRISGTGDPGGLQSMGSHRVGHDWSDLAAAAAAVCIC